MFLVSIDFRCVLFFSVGICQVVGKVLILFISMYSMDDNLSIVLVDSVFDLPGSFPFSIFDSSFSSFVFPF